MSFTYNFNHYYYCCCCCSETCTVHVAVSHLCHVAMETHPPASLGFLKSPPRGAFKLKEAARTAAGSLRTGRPDRWRRSSSSRPSRRACYADCRQPATASGLPYHHPSTAHQRHRRIRDVRCQEMYRDISSLAGAARQPLFSAIPIYLSIYLSMFVRRFCCCKRLQGPGDRLPPGEYGQTVCIGLHNIFPCAAGCGCL